MILSSIFSYVKDYFKTGEGIIKHILWFDKNIDSEENKNYKTKIEYEFSNMEIICTKEEKELYKKINELKFEAFIIIVNGLFFMKIVEYLKTQSINSIPIICIFTRNRNEIKNKIEQNNKKYLEDKFYNRLGICETIEEVIKSIKNITKEVKEYIDNINLGNIENPKDYENCFIFEYIDKEYKLIFPYLYNKIMNNKKSNNEEIKFTNKYILENYGKIDDIKNLILPLFFLENIPENIIAKFWSRIYTCESSFYKNLNNSLMKLENEHYNTYIQLLYSGLNEYIYKENDILYRGANISEKEMDNIIKYYRIREKNEKIENCYLIYSRAYLSFSKDKDISLGFINNIKGTKNVLFQLKNNINNSIYSNADLKYISIIPDENEVLFFPFSSFIIDNIDINNNIYYVDLLYLGVFENQIKNNYKVLQENPILFKEVINNSNFCQDIMKTNIMLNKNKLNENNKDNNENNIEKQLINNIISYNECKNSEKKDIYKNDNDAKDIDKGIKDNKEVKDSDIKKKECEEEKHIIDNKEGKEEIDKKNEKNNKVDKDCNDEKEKENFKKEKVDKQNNKEENINNNNKEEKNKENNEKEEDDIEEKGKIIKKENKEENNIINANNKIQINYINKNIKEDENNISIYKNEIKVMYKTTEKGFEIIFGEKFVENNKNNIELIINGEKSKLIPKYELNEGENDITIIIKNKLTNLEFMFKSCDSLYNINDLKYLNTKDIINFSFMFYECSSLSDIKALENWNVSNGNNFSYMFSGCSSLSNIKALENWNIKNKFNFNIKNVK